MKMTGNSILITGGNTGIGLGLAQAFHGLGNTIIITGRRKDRLDAAVAADSGMFSHVLNVDDHEATKKFAARIVAEHPKAERAGQ
jgi:uncharacterized oxidoreductase